MSVDNHHPAPILTSHSDTPYPIIAAVIITFRNFGFRLVFQILFPSYLMFIFIDGFGSEVKHRDEMSNEEERERKVHISVYSLQL